MTRDAMTQDDTRPAGRSMQGRPMLRPGVDPYPLLAIISTQLDGITATLAALADCFIVVPPRPAAPDAAPPSPPRKPLAFGDPSPLDSSPSTSSE